MQHSRQSVLLTALQNLYRRGLYFCLPSLVVISLSSAGSDAFAHHSPAVFDQTKEVVIEGTVTEFVWANPHSWIHLNVTTDEGDLERWSVEMNPPTYLVRGGWRSNTIKPGDRVRVLIHPLRTNEKAGQYVSITLPDGRVLGEQPAVLGE